MTPETPARPGLLTQATRDKPEARADLSAGDLLLPGQSRPGLTRATVTVTHGSSY